MARETEGPSLRTFQFIPSFQQGFFIQRPGNTPNHISTSAVPTPLYFELLFGS